MLATHLEGDLDGDTALVFPAREPDSAVWGILRFDAAGVPVAIERPADRWCELANGDPITDSEKWGCK
jgi:hypothetical protein